ncbi:MAG: YecA family protein, partial [Gammaproteobacteria bacterium]|nr:YecA family protein [Gammaproteobacteria bacterium]
TEALAHWSEGYLHGLVSAQHGEELKKRLAAEPVAGIIKDLLAFTQATVEDDEESEANEAAYTELVEYLRVTAQLVYEELADLRHRS